MPAVLVVDDDPSLRSLAQIILEHQGYRVLVAEGGPQALQIAQADPGPIDLLVTDLVMPGMDGAELGRQLRALRPAMRVLYITALAVANLAGHTVVLNRIVLDPDVPILVKPFSIEALEQTVRDVLDRAPAHVPAPDAPPHRPGLLTSDESQP
jgi:DNA-binding response OmpR family regulator